MLFMHVHLNNYLLYFKGIKNLQENLNFQQNPIIKVILNLLVTLNLKNNFKL